MSFSSVVALWDAKAKKYLDVAMSEFFFAINMYPSSFHYIQGEVTIFHFRSKLMGRSQKCISPPFLCFYCNYCNTQRVCAMGGWWESVKDHVADNMDQRVHRAHYVTCSGSLGWRLRSGAVPQVSWLEEEGERREERHLFHTSDQIFSEIWCWEPANEFLLGRGRW